MFECLVHKKKLAPTTEENADMSVGVEEQHTALKSRCKNIHCDEIMVQAAMQDGKVIHFSHTLWFSFLSIILSKC